MQPGNGTTARLLRLLKREQTVNEHIGDAHELNVFPEKWQVFYEFPALP